VFLVFAVNTADFTLFLPFIHFCRPETSEKRLAINLFILYRVKNILVSAPGGQICKPDLLSFPIKIKTAGTISQRFNLKGELQRYMQNAH